MDAQKVKWQHVKHHWEIYLFVIPTLITIGLFIYYPAASGIYHSFFRWNGADIAEPRGFENYIDLLTSTAFWRSFKNAFILGIANVIKMIPPLLVAVCIHRCRSNRMQFFYRLLFVIPMVIPPLVVALIWRSFFFEATNGYLNRFIYALNMEGVLNALAPIIGWGDAFAAGKGKPAWLGDPDLIMTAVIIWGFPWMNSLAVLTHLAKLQNIGKEVYEAGEIDGVSWWSKFTRIELPLITGSIYLMLVFAIIQTIIDAGMILALGGFEGGPGGAVDVPALFMIRKAFVDQQMGYACAVGIVLSIIVMSLQKISTLVNNWEQLKPWQKIVFRIFITGVSVTMIVFRQFTFLGVFFLILVFPYEAVRMLFGKLFKNNKDPDTYASVTETTAGPSKGDLRMQRVIAREDNPAFRASRFAGQLMLRMNKHLYIWLVLAFSFLPLYLMLIVSPKTNQQFYEAPAFITQPFHWDNWRVAWEMITPTLANSVFISVSSTLVMVVMAISAAYFFARLKMPLSGFLWNAILILMMLPMIANLVPLFRLLRDLNLLNTLSALILVTGTQGQIMAIFMLRSFVGDVPRDLYEAADIDGASHFQQLKSIVLPLSGSILGTVGVMHFMYAWNEFVLPLIVMRDHARLPVMVQLIRMAGEYIKLWGPLMAGYAMAAIPIIILFMFSMKLFVKGMTEGAVKG